MAVDLKLPLFMVIVMVGISTSMAAKIMLMPAPHYSHVNFHAVAAKALQNDGHDVVVLVPAEFESRVTKVGVRTIPYPHSPEASIKKSMTRTQDGLLTGESSFFSMLKDVSSALSMLCREIFENEELMKMIREEKFDFTINESVPMAFCLYVINHKFDIPYLAIGPWQDPWLAGVSSNPTHAGSPALPFHGHLTFFQRLASLGFEIATTVMSYQSVVGDEFISEFAPEKPRTTFKELVSKAQMFLITAEIYCFDYPKISAPNYRFIGSLSGSAASKPLPKELEDYVHSAKHGVVVVSFGSLTNLRKALLPFIGKLINALGRLPQKAIMQFSIEDLVDIKIPDNVLIQSWLPQNDLLGHPKVKLFVAHGGINGHMESTYHGVPILTLPYQPEQLGNGMRARAKGHGDVFYWNEVTEQELYDSMTELINNPVYRENVKKCADILEDLPSAQDQLVFWVNHILKFGGSHLRPVSADMGMIEFFMIDVFAFIAAVIGFILFTCCYCCRKIKQKCCTKRKEKVS